MGLVATETGRYFEYFSGKGKLGISIQRSTSPGETHLIPGENHCTVGCRHFCRHTRFRCERCDVCLVYGSRKALLAPKTRSNLKKVKRETAYDVLFLESDIIG